MGLVVSIFNAGDGLLMLEIALWLGIVWHRPLLRRQWLAVDTTGCNDVEAEHPNHARRCVWAHDYYEPGWPTL